MSTDTLRLYLAVRVSPQQQIVMAERSDNNEPFAPPKPLPELVGTSTGEDGDPTLTADERVIVFMSTRSGSRDLWYATRADRNAAFGAPKPLAMLNTGRAEEHPQITGDGCRLYFAADQESSDLYTAELL